MFYSFMIHHIKLEDYYIISLTAKQSVFTTLRQFHLGTGR